MEPEIDRSILEISFPEALSLAIRVREELGARFEELAEHLENSRTHEAAVHFREIALRQRETSAALRKAGKDESTPVVGLLHMALPDYSAIRAHMTAHQALHVAVESEQAVYEWFSSLMHRTTDTGVRRLFADLRGEAGALRDRLEKELAGLGREEVDPGLFADEPVAH